MDYRCLIAVPLAALALSASSAESYRVPSGWQAGASSSWPASTTYLLGVAPESDKPGERTLTVQSVGKRQASELGAVWQSVVGYSGKRVRVSAQVKAAGTDGWAGLVVRDSFLPLYLLPVHESGDVPRTSASAAACADWCTVSAVADIPSDGMGAATVGVALIGNGQVWARGLRLETVSADVPLTGAPFAAPQTAALRAQMEQKRLAQAAQPTPPTNLDLH